MNLPRRRHGQESAQKRPPVELESRSPAPRRTGLRRSIPHSTMGLVTHIHVGSCIKGRLQLVQHCDDVHARKIRGPNASLVRKLSKFQCNGHPQRGCIQNQSNNEDHFASAQHLYQYHEPSVVCSGYAHYDASNSRPNSSTASEDRLSQLSRQVTISADDTILEKSCITPIPVATIFKRCQ